MADTKQIWGILDSIDRNEWAIWLTVFHLCICFSHITSIRYGHTARLTFKPSLCSGKCWKALSSSLLSSVKIMFVHALWSWWLGCLKTTSRHFPSPWEKKIHTSVFFFFYFTNNLFFLCLLKLTKAARNECYLYITSTMSLPGIWNRYRNSPD